MSINLINFRELGNIETNDKLRIKSGYFYRGPALILTKLSLEEKDYIDNLNLKHIIDFRSLEEIKNSGLLYVPKNCEYHNIPAIKISDDVNSDNLDPTQIIDSSDIMAQVYSELPFNNDAYKLIFNLIKNNETPLYFHCTAGKDRTGVFSALLELLLGVSKENIFKDYMVSRDIYFNHFTQVLKTTNISPTWLCDKEWLLAAFKAIEKKYSSYDEYFYSEYNLNKEDIMNIRNKYLY